MATGTDLRSRLELEFFRRARSQAPPGPHGYARRRSARRRAVVLISYELWTRLFGGDPKAVGSSLTLESGDYTVIGVLPPHFAFSLLGTKIDIWAPRVFEMSLVTPQRVAADGRYFQV